MRLRRFLTMASAGGLAVAAISLFAAGGASAASWGSGSWTGCANSARLCTEVANQYAVFGHYVGHDEPSVLFDSGVAGSGNHMQYNVTLPKEPAGTFSDYKAYSLEDSPAFWFGMAMCDTQSYPETMTSCPPDSDSNIVNPETTKKGPGAAYMELQFYPPGFAPQFAGFSCDKTRWCVALTIDSLSQDAFTGDTLNSTCTSEIGGSIEYVNFAYLTLNGLPLGPPNPLQFQFTNSGDPQPVPGRKYNDTLFLNQGDNVTVSLSDTANGLSAIVHDNTTGKQGSMVASAANGFGQIKFAPWGHSCTMMPYNFHPMYSTSSPQTRVLWAAGGYNVAMDAETGHFDFCTHIDANTDTCNGKEGIPGDQETAEGVNGDDYSCFSDSQNMNPNYVAPAGQASDYCVNANDPGFDGTPYHRYWPDGSSTHSTAFLFSSPYTGTNYNVAYSKVALETDLPAIESSAVGGYCNNNTGAGCTNPPLTDEGVAASFYPYFSTVNTTGGCRWGAGETLPNTRPNSPTPSSAQYGPLYAQPYWVTGGHGAAEMQYEDYSSGEMTNPC